MGIGRPKGGTNKIWTKEEKEKIVLYHIENEIGMKKRAQIFGISSSQMFYWVSSYRKHGINGLENQKKPGNPLMKYSKKRI